MIILDIGEGTCLDEVVSPWNIAGTVYDVANKVGFPVEEIVLKPQLFEYEPPNKTLTLKMFETIHKAAQNNYMRCTASVFDKFSVEFLCGFEIPFVKIANRPYLRKFTQLVPRGVPVYMSYSPDESDFETGRQALLPEDVWLQCIGEYPADEARYDLQDERAGGISDHTIGLDLYRKYRPVVYEKHFYLTGMKGPSIGEWAIDENGLEVLLREALK